MSKNKKKPQKNLSLKERLAKHWNNRNWDMFTELFLRDREASIHTIWANNWNDALYNLLTKALFVDKNPANAEAALALINEERSAFGISDELADCAGVVSDFLKARRSISMKELSPLVAKDNLPAVYANLRKGLSSFISTSVKKQKTQKDGTTALLEKFAEQYANLGRTITAARCTAWLKTAEQLESLSKGAENERVFRAIRAIAALIRELLRKGKGENMLRNPEDLFYSRLFEAIPPGQTHPAVRSLWEFFCRTGEQKYGAEWGEAARVLRLTFTAEKSLHHLVMQYHKLVIEESDSLDILTSKIIRSSAAWTEQELYILNTIFTDAFDTTEFDEYDDYIIMQFLEAFNTLTRLGRKWRPEAPWVKTIQDNFDILLHECPLDIITSIITNFPYDAVSPYGLVILSLKSAKHLKAIEKTVPLPLRLNEKYIGNLLHYLTPSRDKIKILYALLGRAEYISISTRLIRHAAEESADAARMDKPLSQQPWTKFSRGGFIEELAATLPPDNFAGCFCRLCSDMPPYRISSDQSKIEEFFAALPVGTDEERLADCFMFFILTWPDIDPAFILRLFEKSHLFRNRKKRTGLNVFALEPDMESLAIIVERMKNKADRKKVVIGILSMLGLSAEEKKSYIYKSAVKILEHLVKEGNSKEASPFLGKAKKPRQEITGQGKLPFD